MKKYTLILIPLLFIGCNFNKTYRNREEDKQEAEKITEKFYSLIKNNNRKEALKLFGEKFKLTRKDQLNKMLNEINSSCGSKISDTKLTTWETFVSIGTNPKSEYVLLYKINRNIKNTQEKITLEKNNDSIKIVGYDVSLAE
ncbi:hypothetical protein BBH99_05325 [Chryseobacterium contaminans]|uniref:DUF3887 domain-containing protein n=1 Tax=Chryseobacterium contaminans TaxID=1423959 RepID=A0A1M7FPT0_9FLAO|nr:hypothetical protein [Chryseobacterium contaminans]OCA79866.1 hypothetical protein BBH99_05325 [Chryseobacterium contaminans]SHM06043.1 hypothetical protein SAMN05444407_10910 [Chryseobacterium contaminans]